MHAACAQMMISVVLIACLTTTATAEGMTTGKAKKTFASLLKPKAADPGAVEQVKEDLESEFLAKLRSAKNSIIDIEDFQQYQLFLNKTAAVGNVLFFTAPNCPRCKTIEKMLVKSAKMLKKDEETKDKFKYAKIDGTKLTNTTSGGLVAAELEIPGAPAIYWFKVKAKITEVKLREFGTGMESPDNMFDYMKEEISGHDKLGRVKMGNYYFDQKMFKEKLDGLGYGDIELGTDEEGKSFIDTSKMTKKEAKQATDDAEEKVKSSAKKKKKTKKKRKAPEDKDDL